MNDTQFHLFFLCILTFMYFIKHLKDLIYKGINLYSSIHFEIKLLIIFRQGLKPS